MEYVDFVVSWLSSHPRMATAWTVVIMLSLAWLWRGHRASKARAQLKPPFKPRLRTRGEQARVRVVDTVYTPKSYRRKRPPR